MLVLGKGTCLAIYLVNKLTHYTVLEPGDTDGKGFFPSDFANQRDLKMREASSQETDTLIPRSSGFRLPMFPVVRAALGLIFIWASIDKILHPSAFGEIIYAYQILPDPLISATAIALPWIELVLGTLLVLGFWLPGAIVLTNLLLVTFLAALIYNMIRGLDVDCGCFSTGGRGGGAMWSYLLRDLLFLVVSGLLLVHIIFRNDRRQSGSAKSTPVHEPSRVEG
jgi:uncharacterized membrane protein YphA (DoxX/SURF4 family)